MTDIKRAILFYNSEAGQSNILEHRGIIQSHFKKHQIQLVTYLIPDLLLDIEEIVRKGISQGVELFIGAGGDGTVSLVGNALVGTEFPFGIIPLGTGNLLAKELGIPTSLQDALNTITAINPPTKKIDTFLINGHHYVLNVSVGISPNVMAMTPPEEKQKLGVKAYLIRMIQQLLGLKLHRFDIEYDQKRISINASEILLTNSRTMGFESLKWSEIVSLDDGKLDLFIFRARNIFDVLGLILSIFRKKETRTLVKFVQFSDYCRIETRSEMNTQADGDLLGKTPVEVSINPLSLNIITGSSLEN